MGTENMANMLAMDFTIMEARNTMGTEAMAVMGATVVTATVTMETKMIHL